MKVKSEEVRAKLKALWPNLRHVWLFDQDYWLPFRADVEAALAESKVDRMRFLPSVADCDDFALQLHADIKRVRSFMAACGQIPREQWAPWAFGETMGRRFAGSPRVHAINICVTSESVLLIEPQKDAIWEAHPERDDPFFVKM